MARVLLVTYEFPPRGGPGVQRPLKFAKYLGEFGWDVTVLTVADPPTALVDNSLLDEIPDTVDVVRAWSLEPTRIVQALRRLRRLRRPSTEGHVAAAGGSAAGYSGVSSGIIRAVQGLFVPDEKRFWKSWAVKAGMTVFRNTPFDAVVSSGPPHTAHLIASSIAARRGVPHFVDLRDPWVGYFAATYLTPFHRIADARAERRVVLRSAGVVTVTESIAAMYSQRYPHTKILVIPNGFDPGELPPRAERSGKLSIVYTGTFSGPRQPDTFFQGMARAEQRVPAIVQDVRISMAGVSPEIAEAARMYGVRCAVEGLGYVSHSRSLELLGQADVALLVLSSGPESDVSLSGKIFEYVGMQLPILAVVGPGEAADFVGSLEGGRVAAFDDPDAIARSIVELHAAWLDGGLVGPSPATAVGYSRITQAGRWAEALESAVRKDAS